MPSKPDSKPKYDFRTCLKKSDVLKPEVLEKWLSENPDQSPAEDAAQLVRQKLLTEWQAKYLLSGRYRLHLGNYQLLRRVRRDSFGDRFIALHPQLGRTVQVQVLPVELTNDANQRDEFLTKAGLAGELDHPNLAHVFDIDMQQGRYYLVTEYDPSVSLTELRVLSLDAPRVAGIVRDSILGLKHAHERSVVHDNLTMDNVLVNEDGVVKISQIALSPLAKKTTKMARENVSPEQGDLLAIVRMGRRLLKDAPSTTATRQLTTLLSNLNTKDETAFNQSLTELELWIEQSSEESLAHESVKESTIDSNTPIAVPDGEIERLQKNAELTESQKTQSRNPKGRRGEIWDTGPGSKNGMRLATLGAVTVLLGVLVHFGLQAIRKSAPARPVSQRQTSLQQAVTTSTRNRSLLSPQTVARVSSPKDTNMLEQLAGKPPRDVTEILPLTNETTLPPPVVNPSAFGPKPDGDSKTVGTRSLTSALPKSANTAGDQTYTDRMFETNKAEPPIQSDAKTEPDPREKEPAAGFGGNAAVSSTKPNAAQDTAQTDSQSEADEKQESEDPFDGFSNSFDLPITESSDQVILATLKRSSIHLLGMELKSAEGIGKGRTSFALERNETTKRQWTLLAKKSPRNNGDPVGQFDFDKTSGQIKFHWLPKAASSRIANYVRNCVLKMKLGSSSRTMALRSPVRADLKMSRTKPSATIEADLEWLPNPELLTVEVLPLKQVGMPKTWIESAIVQPGTPAIIHFHEAASNRFMWLQLDSSIRKKVTLDLNLMLKHADGTVQAITRAADVKKLQTLLQKAAVKAQQEYDANKDIVAPKGQITKFKDYVAKLKSTAKKTLKQSQIAGENTTIVETFYDRVLPVRLIFRADDYQVVLLESAP